MLRNSNEHINKKDKENKKGNGFFQWMQTIFSAPASTAPTPISGFSCNDNVCRLVPPSQPSAFASASPSSLSYLSTRMEEDFSHGNETSASNYLSSILPPDYYEAMKQAAKMGFLYSFISATPTQYFASYFKAQRLTSEQIYYANQVIRAITILSLSAYLGTLDMKSLCMTIGIPISSIGMKCLGINETVSQLLPTAIIISAEILSDLSSTVKTVGTIMTAASLGWVGNRTAEMGYNVVQNSLFAFRKQLEKMRVAEISEDRYLKLK